MKLRDLIPPVLMAGFQTAKTKAFTALASAFIHADDLHEGQANHLVWPYRQSAWVHAAVNYVADEIAGRELCFYQGDQPYSEAAFDAWWTAPALGPRTNQGTQPRLSITEVRRDLAAWAKLEGEFFLCFDDTWAVAGLRRNPAVLTPFLIAVPSRMRHIVRAGVLEGWEYVTQDGKRMLFLPEQVIHWKAFNPNDEWRGLGDYKAAQIATEGAYLTGAYIRDLMRNNGDQGAIISAKSGSVTDEQREQIVAALQAKRRAIRLGIAKDVFVNGEISVERSKEQSAGTDVIAGKALSHQEIFIAFGVPPSMAEVKASYSIGKDSDYYQLIIRTCMPLGGHIAGALATVASRMTGRPLMAQLEWDDHPVMIEVRNSRLDIALKLWGAGMSWRDINTYLDLGMESFKGWEIPYLPFSVSPVVLSGAPVDDPSLAEDNAAAAADGKGRELPEISMLKLLLAAKSRAATPAPVIAHVERDVLAGFTCGCGDPATTLSLSKGIEGYAAQKADRPPTEIARWKDYMNQRRETVKAFSSAFGRVLMTARIEVLRKIEAKYQPTKAIVGKTAAADLLFDLSDFTRLFTVGMRKQQQGALDKSGQQLFQELGKDDPFSFSPPEVQSFLSGRQNKLSGVPGSIFDRIRDSLQAGIDAGDSTKDLAARVKAEFNTLGDTEAMRIAQTETSAAYGHGRQEAMFKAGVKYKAWLTSGNANVRAAHQEAGLTYPVDGGIPLDEPFIVDGEELMHPGDSEGSPGNVINCHCVSVAVREPEPLS